MTKKRPKPLLPKPRRPSKSASHSGTPLSDAAFEFWDILFPGEDPPEIQIRKWVVMRMLGADSESPASRARIAPSSVLDAEALGIVVTRTKATMTAPRVDAVERRLFGNFLGATYYPDWSRENPLHAIAQTGFGQNHRNAIRYLFEFTVEEAGHGVLNALHANLESGALIASGRESASLTAAEVEIPLSRLRHATIDITNGRISGPDLPAVIDVRLRRAIAPPQDKSGGQSFAEDDAPLIEEMRELIQGGHAKSVSDAAEQVAPKAKRLGRLKSVVERLRRAYGRKYPTRKALG